MTLKPSNKAGEDLGVKQIKIRDFQQLREAMLQDLKKPKNKAVFERLKDK